MADVLTFMTVGNLHVRHCVLLVFGANENGIHSILFKQMRGFSDEKGQNRICIQFFESDTLKKTEGHRDITG
jgi:hypothetical protein